ncbi:MAG TPA: ABC transporter substrate-binding protein, partial [Devosia sp.]
MVSLTGTVVAEDVTIRYLGSAGGLAAHELAAELGYFEGTGITLENVGNASGGPESL